jgi:hypothetical protein
MPVSRTTRASRQAPYSTANALPMAGQHSALSGPRVCLDIANNGQVDSKEGIKAALLQEAKRVAGPCPKVRGDCCSKCHDICKPFVGRGLTNPADFGRWTQIVSYQPDEAHSETDNDFDNSA